MKFFLLSSIFFLALNVNAVSLKIATIAPEGTSLAISLKKMALEIEQVTKGEVNLKNYLGGVAGDEPDVLRKIRIGQMNGGFFTGKTLGDIYGDIRVMELPFNFYNDTKKAEDVFKSLYSYFNIGLDKNGFVNLGFFNVGHVYVVSTKEVKNIESMKGVKVWAWEGDELVLAMTESLGLVTVPLALPDVLSSLSTGVVNAAYAPPIGILGLQWQSKIKYLINFPTAFSVGALLISKKDWNKISAQNQKIILEISDKYIKEANLASSKENEEGLVQLKRMGIEFINFPKSDYDQAKSIREKVINKLKNKLISQEAINKLNQGLK
jgi:TRAP-type C4-dicarboxylate transport system substrate-binding protein